MAGDQYGAALGGQVLEQGADPEHAVGVEPVDRLVEDDAAGSPSSAAAMPSRWPIPSEKPPARRCATCSRPTIAEDLVDPRRRDAVGLGQREQMVPALRPLWNDRASKQRTDLAQRCALVGVAAAVDGRAAGGGRSSPTIIRMVVDLPAPLGPRNPVT